MIRGFKKYGGTDLENQIQDAVGDSLSQIAGSAIINGVLIKNVSLSTGATNFVAHKLGRDPQGWIIVRQRANAIVWDAQDQNQLKSRTLALEASANVVCDLWIF